jgi:hypothetical protein
MALLLGSLLTLVFARVGYLSVKAFYTSYTRSWVTRANIEAMLRIHTTPWVIGNQRTSQNAHTDTPIAKYCTIPLDRTLSCRVCSSRELHYVTLVVA